MKTNIVFSLRDIAKKNDYFEKRQFKSRVISFHRTFDRIAFEFDQKEIEFMCGPWNCCNMSS